METKKKVLVIDDEEAVVQAVSDMLEERGFEVLGAENGKEGLRKFNENNPDLVITDIIMPDMEGIELIKVMGKKGKKTRIIVMSGHPMGKKFLKIAEMFGAVNHLLKPFSRQELFDAVEEVLGQ